MKKQTYKMIELIADNGENEIISTNNKMTKKEWSRYIYKTLNFSKTGIVEIIYS